jgi:hypothetical protein
LWTPPKLKSSSQRLRRRGPEQKSAQTRQAKNVAAGVLEDEGVVGGKIAEHDTRRIQDWLGHRSIQHTARYTQLSSAPFKDFWR